MGRKRLTPDDPPQGRPSKFTDDVKAKLVKALKLGATHELAAMYAGIGASTFYAWKKRAEDGDPEYQEFVETLNQSESIGAIAALEKITDSEDWKAAAWLLERRYPEMYGRQKLDVNHSGEVTLAQKAYKDFTPDQWDADDDHADS